MLSSRALNGIFQPFEDTDFVRYLKLHDLESIQHFDVGTSTWVTLLKNSPPVIVKEGGTYHFKDVDIVVSISDIVGDRSPIIKTSSRLAKIDGDDDVFNIFSNTPSKRRRESTIKEELWEDLEIGSRPCKLSKFPGKTVKEVGDRIGWICANDRSGSLEKRFSAVYMCQFHSSTYHRHQNAWKWLLNSGRIHSYSDGTLWRDASRQAWKEIRGVQDDTPMPSSDAITVDLTLDDV